VHRADLGAQIAHELLARQLHAPLEATLLE
jgi:hypothetical protein